jgi:hypothetical protein
MTIVAAGEANRSDGGDHEDRFALGKPRAGGFIELMPVPGVEVHVRPFPVDFP